MPTLVLDTELEERLRAARSAFGADRYDEVWEGTYMMAPMPNDEHQQIVNALASIFQESIGWSGLGHVRPGVNVSDRKQDWQQNYRVPDVAVFLEGGAAENCDTFWFGGPDFAVEVISPGDPIEDKLKFYADVNVRELLLVDRNPWELRLLGLDGQSMRAIGKAEVDKSSISSNVLPFEFALRSGQKRPVIDVRHSSGKSWAI